MLLSACIAISLVNILFSVGVLCLPLYDSGPHIANGWGQPVRLRHLYAARYGVNLQIKEDGKVDGSPIQSSYSLLEIGPIDAGFVAIKGVASSQYLCMEQSGKLYGSHIFVKEDCSFQERILSGYNIYISAKTGAVVSLSSDRQRAQARQRGPHELSQFLPMLSNVPLEPADVQQGDPGRAGDPGHGPLSHPQVDSMDPFGKLSHAFIQSPSFNKR